MCANALRISGSQEDWELRHYERVVQAVMRVKIIALLAVCKGILDCSGAYFVGLVSTPRQQKHHGGSQRRTGGLSSGANGVVTSMTMVTFVNAAILSPCISVVITNLCFLSTRRRVRRVLHSSWRVELWKYDYHCGWKGTCPNCSCLIASL